MREIKLVIYIQVTTDLAHSRDTPCKGTTPYKNNVHLMKIPMKHLNRKFFIL